MWRLAPIFATAFAQHPLRHPVIGHLDVFNQIGRDDLLAYYRERYAPNNIFFVIVGDLDPVAVQAQMTEFFAKHPRRPLPHPASGRPGPADPGHFSQARGELNPCRI